MPFSTLYQIFDSKHTAPVFTNTDYKMAYVEWRSYLRKGGDVYRLEQTVLPDGNLDKSEQYLFLVYRARKTWKRFVNCGRTRDDMLASMDLHKELDELHSQVSMLSQKSIDPLPIKNREAFDFFQLVADWRNCCRSRKKFTSANGYDEISRKEISRQCRDYEKKIDKYIKDKLNLL